MRAVGAGPEDDILEVLADVCLPLRPQQDFTTDGSDRSTGEVQRGTTNGCGDFVERESELPHRCFRDLYGDLVGTGADQSDLGHSGQRGDLISDLFADYF